jgi:hypothetical protein
MDWATLWATFSQTNLVTLSPILKRPPDFSEIFVRHDLSRPEVGNVIVGVLQMISGKQFETFEG